MSEDLPAPRQNPHFQGHDAAEAALLEAYRGGRMAHAWLIAGPPGIGKATLAYRFARFLLAQGAAAGSDDLFAGTPPAAPSGLHVDPEHPVFRRVASGGHADLLSVERSPDSKGRMRSEVVVEDTRAVGGFLALTAAEGGWRVVVIDCADEMNRNAANAVLKVLEEPPSRALLLLVSHNPGRLLPTVRSRCRRLVLGALPAADVEALVHRYRPDVDAGDAAELARLAGGSIGRAMALAEEGGLELYRDVVGLLETLPGLDVARLHALGDKVGRKGADAAFATATDLLRWWLARLIRSSAGAGVVDDGAGDEALMRRLGGGDGLDRWLEVWEKVNRLLARAGGANLERKQVFLNAFLALEEAARG